MNRAATALLVSYLLLASTYTGVVQPVSQTELTSTGTTFDSSNTSTSNQRDYVVQGSYVHIEPSSVLPNYTGGSNQLELVLESEIYSSNSDFVAFGSSLYLRGALTQFSSTSVIEYNTLNGSVSSLSTTLVTRGPVIHEEFLIWRGSSSTSGYSMFVHDLINGTTTEHSYSSNYVSCGVRPTESGFFVCLSNYSTSPVIDVVLVDVSTFISVDSFTIEVSRLNHTDLGLQVPVQIFSINPDSLHMEASSLFMSASVINTSASAHNQTMIELDFSTGILRRALVQSSCQSPQGFLFYRAGTSAFARSVNPVECADDQYFYESTNNTWVEFARNSSRVSEIANRGHFLSLSPTGVTLSTRGYDLSNQENLVSLVNSSFISGAFIDSRCVSSSDGCRGPVLVGGLLYFIQLSNGTSPYYPNEELYSYNAQTSTLKFETMIRESAMLWGQKPLLQLLGNLWYFNSSHQGNVHLVRYSPPNVSAWIHSNGAMPDGLKVNDINGSISGTPTQTGNYSFNITQVTGPVMQNSTIELTVLSDFDGDGLPDELPQNYTGTLLEDEDDDEDGWSDLDEQRCQSDQLNNTSQPYDYDQNGICDISVESASLSHFVGAPLSIPIEVTLESHNLSRTPNAQITTSISPALPMGLNFNISSSILEGIPTSHQDWTEYELTISNTTRSLSIRLNLKFVHEPLNVSFVYPSGTEFLLIVGSPFSHQFVNTGGQITGWSSSAGFPNGFDFSKDNLTLFGTSVTAFPTTTALLTFSNSAGEQIVPITFRSIFGDTDGDGVDDDSDNCGSTAFGSDVDSNGCAEYQKDSDSDGITDDIDSCPGTHNQFDEVDQNGCSPSQLDDDQDGIENSVDVCPNTPIGTAPDAHGCSDAQRDTDGDGITDDIDQCPNTSMTDSADSRGCGAHQLDSDGDGVVDAVDECHSSPPNTRVNSVGCTDVTDTGGDGGSSSEGPGSEYVDNCPISTTSDLDCDHEPDSEDKDSDADMIQDIIEMTDRVGTVGVTDLTYLHELQWERTSTGVKFTLDYRVHEITGYSYQIGVVNMIYPNGTARPSEDLLRVFSEEDKAYLEQRLCEQPDGISDFSPVDWLSSSVRYQGATITPDSTSCTWENQPRKVSAGFLPRSTLDPSNIAKYDTRLTYEFEFSLPQTVATLVILPIDDTSWDYEHPRDRAYSIQTSEDTSKALFTWFQHATISLPAFSSSEDGSSQDETSSVSVPPGSITYNVKTTLNTGTVDCQVFTDSDVRQLTVYPGSSSRIYSSEDIDIVCLGLGENWDSPDMDFCIELMYSSRTLRQGCDVGSSVQVTLAYDNFGESSDDTYDWEQDLSDWEQELQNDLNNLFDYEDPNQDGDATRSSGSSGGGDGLGFIFCTLPTIGGVVLLVFVLSRQNNTTRRAQTQRPAVTPHTPAMIVPTSVPVPPGLETVSPVQHSPEIVASDPVPVPPGLGQTTNVRPASEETNPEPDADTGETVVENLMSRGNSPSKAPDFIHNVNEPEIGRFAEHYDDEGYEWVTFDEKSWYRPAGERIPWELWTQDQ